MKDEYIVFFWKACRILFVIFIIGAMFLGLLNEFVFKIITPTVNAILTVIAIFFTILIGIRYFIEFRIWWSRPKGSRKGGVSKIIPEELVPKLEQILRNSGIEVISLPSKFERADEFKIPKFQLQCSIPESDKVVVYFTRYKQCLDKLIICLQPTVSRWWKLKPDIRTLDRIRSILEENGATELPPEL